MGSEVSQKIEKLLLYLRHKDPKVRYGALHKLNEILYNDSLEQFRSVIIHTITKFSLNDPIEKIKTDAKKIIYVHEGLEGGGEKKSLFFSSNTLFVGLFSVFFILVVIYFAVPNKKPVAKDSTIKKPTIVENHKKYSLAFKVDSDFKDDINIEIKNKVMFKGRPLFTNVTKLKLNRRIEKVYPSGAFIMQQKISEASGVTSDLHSFGYPNPGEVLLITYSPIGRVKAIKQGKKRVLSKFNSGFSKYVLPKAELVVGESWIGEGLKNFQFNNVVYAKKYKLFRLLFKVDEPQNAKAFGVTESSSQGEIFLDFKTRLPLLSKAKMYYSSESKKTSVSLSTVTTITETSSKLDKLRLESMLDESVTGGMFGSQDENKDFRGVTE